MTRSTVLYGSSSVSVNRIYTDPETQGLTGIVETTQRIISSRAWPGDNHYYCNISNLEIALLFLLALYLSPIFFIIYIDAQVKSPELPST